MPERKQIRLLPVNVANKIAAGEVVERPASVVKELLENALDAGATRVEVVVTAGGRKLISVADNGCGMDRDNALMCLEPQATSKIRDVDDIERISTYGFRGEAIPSIAAVSRLTLKTCAEGDTVGTCIEVAGGQLQNVAEIGFPPGSTFEVRDLFFNVPARRKFLKSFQTEQTHLRLAFILQALSHPEIALRLKADGRDIFNLAAGATLAERITDLFGREFLAAMRPVDYAVGDIRVSGYVGIPTLNRADRGEQYLFVNRRAASAAVIPYALREAYPPLDGDRKPVVVLFVDLPPTEVDVNVHPTKREVRFRDASAVRDAVIAAVTRALGIAPKSPVGTAMAVPTGVPGSQFPVPGPQFPVQPLTTNHSPLTTSPFPVPSSQFPVQPLTTNHSPLTTSQFPVPSSQFPVQPLTTHHSPLTTTAAGGDAGSASSASASPPAAQSDLPQLAPEDSPWAWCRVLGQIADGYILIETDGGYAVIDPQAAHERVIYERMMAALEATVPLSQPLLIPESVALSPVDASRIQDNIEILRGMGFGLDPFGGKGEFIVDALPAGIETVDCRALLADIAHGIETAGVRRGSAKWREKAVAMGAARAAIPQVAQLPPEAQARLVNDLARTKMPYTSPRGRPTMLFTSLGELARKFNRAQS